MSEKVYAAVPPTPGAEPYWEGAKAGKLEGPALTKFMTTLNEFLSFFDKVDKRVRHEVVTGMLTRLAFTARTDFEGDKKNPPTKITRLTNALEKGAKTFNLKDVKSHFEEEHNLWEVHFTDAQGSTRIINWALAHTPEFRQMMAKFKQIEEQLVPPFLIERATRALAAAESDVETEADVNDIAEFAG